MGLRRLHLHHFRFLLFVFPLSVGLFGTYQQFLWDQTYDTYRNKSKMFGGKQLKEGELAWR